MTIKQIDLSTDFTKLQNAGAKEKEAKFFMRSHSAADELKGPALTSYIKRRLLS